MLESKQEIRLKNTDNGYFETALTGGKMKISILGFGSWGTAISNVLANKRT